jgi:hypothetical protein
MLHAVLTKDPAKRKEKKIHPTERWDARLREEKNGRRRIFLAADFVLGVYILV